MQPNKDWRRPGWRPRRGRQSRAYYVKLWLLIGFSLAVIVLGRHHSGLWRSPRANDPLPSTVSGRGDPVDGDSLWVGRDEVRLKGIDAPEGRQDCTRAGVTWRCGEAAREALDDAIGGDTVTCAISERDVYGRMLGVCRAGGRDLNAGMVASGMAVAYGAYRTEQGSARSRKIGIWSGEFEMPRDWRAARAKGSER